MYPEHKTSIYRPQKTLPGSDLSLQILKRILCWVDIKEKSWRQPWMKRPYSRGIQDVFSSKFCECGGYFTPFVIPCDLDSSVQPNWGALFHKTPWPTENLTTKLQDFTTEPNTFAYAGKQLNSIPSSARKRRLIDSPFSAENTIIWRSRHLVQSPITITSSS